MHCTETRLKRGFSGDLVLLLGTMNHTARVHTQPHCLFLLDTLGFDLCLSTSSGGKRRKVLIPRQLTYT
ncbi:hypothetical protein I3760_07G153400 [Carya illinoinensis]|uniref:Uncharacterized protein n=1 Tax=Carya illinoinensis TaxID=32201 RepID=A0A922JGP3_CARIL|nr:hypothetical protein I3760_07G153400 [Carya illinoinensis]KAG6704962.1 hypothetical protein I3842_07G158000 [Carya illinoinensis]